MRRREFITLLGGTAAWPLAAHAQQSGMPVIGFLHSTSLDGYTDNFRAFHQGLKDIGYIEGENVTIDQRWAENQTDRLPALAAELVRRQATVIAAGGAPASVAAAKATTTIPIVFMVPEDPVQVGLVDDLSHPGGNITGLSSFYGDLDAKRLALLKETVPQTTRIAALLNMANSSVKNTWKETENAAQKLGIAIQLFSTHVSPKILRSLSKLRIKDQ